MEKQVLLRSHPEAPRGIIPDLGDGWMHRAKLRLEIGL